MAIETLAVNLLLNASQYKREARSAATATGQISSSTATAGTAAGKLQNQMSGLAATAKFAVAGVAVGAVTKFGKDSVQAFLGFDDKMNESLAIMGDVSDTMKTDMADAAREIGKTSRIGAEEAAEAYFFLASAGLDAEQSIAALPQVAKFAQAGMFDMAVATDLATDAQSALGLRVDDAQQNLVNLTRVTDVFTKANILANTSVEQVSEAMTNKAGAAMRSVGVDIEEGTAVLAAFADQGVKGAEAGTQFSIVLRDLQTRALANKEAFEQAGIAVFDSQGEFRNFADIIGDLEGRLAGMSDAQKKAELATLGFTDKSISALTVLLGTSDAIREYETELRKAGGTTEEVANKQLESFQGQLDLLKGRITDVQIALGEGLVPALVGVADAFLPFVELMGRAIGGLGELGDLIGGDGAGIAGLVDVIVDSLPGLGVFLDGVEFVNDALGDTPDAADGAAAAIEAAGLSTADFTDHAASLESELDALHGTTGDVTSSTGGLTGAVDEAAGAFEETKLQAQDAKDAIEAYDEAFRRLTDPVFRAISDQQRLADALTNYQTVAADAEASTADVEEALFGLLEAQQEANSSASALPETMGRTEQAFALLVDQLELTDEEFAIIEAAMDRLDGRTIRVDFEAFFRAGGNQSAMDAIIGGTGTRRGGLISRQHGGPVRGGQPAIVGERGPELFIPQQNGFITSRNDTDRLIAAMGGMGGANIQITLEGTGDPGIDAQRVGAAYSVVRRMETI